MRKFILTVFACLLLATSSANAEMLKDDAGFSYWNSYNYLVHSAGSQIVATYDLSSIHIIADNNSRFEFNVIDVAFRGRDGSIDSRHVINIREDYGTGNIFVNGNFMGDSKAYGKTYQEIYYKMKSVALIK